MKIARRRWLIAQVAGGLALPSTMSLARTGLTGTAPMTLEERSLADLVDDLNAGRTSCERLLTGYLERIERLDRAGPKLASVIEIDPRALDTARALDAEQRRSGRRGPLHGLPILLKDNIGTRDRLQTTAGSLALVGGRPREDAAVAERLRAAGALIFGKTNLSEWANFRAAHSTSGWSARGGLTRNPYVLDRSASGSSSGSAVAVAASLCAAAVGTETDGSIVSPAASCGIVGLKPTVGAISRRGIVPISISQDTAGPMARTVRDCALLFDAMRGSDPGDPATAGAPPGASSSTAGLDTATLLGARLGVVREFFGFHEATDRVFDGVLERLRAAGAVLVDPVALPDLGTIDAAETSVLLHEFKVGLNAYLAGLEPGAAIRSLADLIAFNERHADRELPWFGQDLFVKAEATRGLDDPDYRQARARCLEVARGGIDAAVARHRLDALIAPTGGPPWRTDLTLGDHFVGGSSTPAAVAGTPSLTVPAGFVHGLPVGLSFFAEAWSEARLLQLGHAFEAAMGGHRAPRYLATIEPA